MSKTAGWAPLFALAMLSLAGGALAQEAKPSLAEPALSPNGAEIAFASGGDIWTVPAAGGVASLLITDPATDLRPVYSPDGTQLAFQSTRNGAPNIYILTFATGQVRRLTFSDAGEVLDGWSKDGKWLYFSSTATDVGRQNDIFRVASTGGTPLEVSRERYLNEFESAASPDGMTIAVVAKGISNGQWWRNGHSHIDQTELWLKPLATDAPYRRLLPADAKHAWPMWSPDGASLFYMSDESGAENVWRLSLAGGAPSRVTQFADGRLLYPSISASGGIVFERGFGIWKLDPGTGQAAQVPITLRGAPAAAGERQLSESSFRALSLSPDGKKVAVIAHGEVFAATAKDGGPAQRISRTPTSESQITWSPDSKRLLYVSEIGTNTHLVEYDFAKAAERSLTTATALDEAPVYSPDGKSVAYVHASKELHVLTLGADGKPASDTVVFSKPGLAADVDSPPVWSPDGRWVAFIVTDARSFNNIHVVEAAGGEARPVTFLANGNTGGKIAWSPDGTYLLFSTSQRSEDSKMVRVDLLPHVPKYREDAFRDLFKPAETPDKPVTKPGTRPGAPSPAKPAEAAPAAADGASPAADTATPDKPKKKPEPVRIVFDGIRDRATMLPLGLSAEEPVISPDGKTLVFRASSAGLDGLYSYDLDELAKEPPVPQQLAASKKPKGDYAFAPDSKSVFYLEGGAILSTPIESPKPKPLAISADMTVDFDVEKRVVFDQAWSTLDRRFFDASFNGKDWKGLRAQWAPYVAGARTPDELRRIVNLLIGELNASHSGINRPPNGPGSAPGPRVGDLGLRFDRDAYEAGRGLVVREVVALGPAAIDGAIKPGDVLLAVNGVSVGPGANLDQALMDQIGKRVVLRIAPGGVAASARDAVVRPVSLTVEAGLAYRQWVNERRAYVEKISGGKLGYVHIADMSDQSLAQLYIDLDAQNQGRQGVVIDVRNNNGGYVNGYVLDVFSRRNFLTMTPRDLFAMPSRQALGQRALGLPTVLVTNESSLSDAEDFTEGYRTLGVGKVVGVPTAGWIIFTGGQPLIDGSVVRVPGYRIRDLRGQDMEMNPRPVDVTVERPLGETMAGRDAQLEAAVKVLLGEPPKP